MSLSSKHTLEAQKLILSFLESKKKKFMMSNAVKKSHFSYCPLIWIYIFQTFNKLIKKSQNISKNSVWWHYNTRSTFEEFLQLVKCVSVHHKNIQILTTEVHRISNDIYPPTMKIFKRKTNATSKISRTKAKNKNYLIWPQNSILPHFATKFSWI